MSAKIKAELQVYLSEKNINSIFVDIVEHLLIDKPENPEDYIIQHLIKKYPKQTERWKIQDEENTKRNNSSLMCSPSDIKSQLVTDDETESELESELDDKFDDEIISTNKRQSTSHGNCRRQSVCAELVDPNAQQPDLIKHEKTNEELQRINEIISQNLMFKHLDACQKNQVCDAMFSVIKEAGDSVITEGEEGDNFYIIEEGIVDIFIVKEGVSIKVKSMTCGESFGELALMYSTPRSATCVADTKVKLWALDRISFKIILMQTTIKRRNQYKEILAKVPILQELNEYEVLTVADSLFEEAVAANTVVCRQGDVGDAFYIIKEGAVVCHQTDTSGDTTEVARLTSGHYFGELALMTCKARQATVVTTEETSLLKLDRKTFQRIFGRMEDILKRNMESYRKIQAQSI